MELYNIQSISESIGLLKHIYKNNHFDTDLSPRELQLEFDKIFFIHFKHLCEVTAKPVKNEGSTAI